MINVEFTDGTVTLTKEFQFSIESPVEVMKRAVKQYLDELNFVPPTLDGDITDVPEEVPTPPTQDELDKQAWEADFAKLEKVKRLIDCGVLTGQETAVVSLRNKVKADFKLVYLA